MPALTLQSGRKLAWREAGSGAPLILVHGSPAEGRAWSRVAGHLAAHYRLLMPDLPGYGGSEPLPDTAARTEAMAAAIVALIDTCDRPVRLCGHSYGGNIALHAALAAEPRVEGLVLFEPVFFRALELAGDERTLLPAARFFTGYADRVTAGDQDAVSEMVDYWFGPGAFAALPDGVSGFLKSSAARNGADVRATFAERVTAAHLAAFTKRVRVVHGGASLTAAAAIAAALVKLLPNAEGSVIAGAGHGMLDTHAAAVAETLRAP